MISINQIKYYLINPGKAIIPLASRGLFNWIPDETYLKIVYRGQMSKRLNLNPPITFNEKLQWLKLHDRKHIYHKLVDKAEVKKYISRKIGEEYIIPTIGIWETVEEIPFDKLPSRFVIKCTHDSGSVIICEDKSKFDINSAKKKLNYHLKKSTYWFGREWPYKGLKPRVIVEELIGDGVKPLADYKVLCFNGVPKLVEVHLNRGTASHTQDFYDIDWNRTEIEQTCEPMANTPILPPGCLEQMLELSELLSKEFIHIRVDWYTVDDRLYFGELTFYDGSGFAEFVDDKWDYMLGKWIQLPNKIDEINNGFKKKRK